MKRRAVLLQLGLALTLCAFAGALPVGAQADLQEDEGEQVAAGRLTPDTPAPSGVAVDTDGSVYVTDYAGDHVLKFAPDGSLLAQWGSRGTAPGQFSGPFGVVVDRDGTLLVTDQLNNRVQRLAADGTPLASWGSAGSGAGQLRTPFGLATVAGGGVAVADFGNDRVNVFGTDGAVVRSWGSRGTGDQQFTRTAGIAVDRETGAFYVSDHFNDRVQKFSADGTFLLTIGGGPSAAITSAPPDGQVRRPEGLAVDRDGNVLVADYGRNRVAKFTPDGRFVMAFGSSGTANGEFSSPKGVAVDLTSGRIYVADTGNGRVQRFLADGTFDAAWPLPHSATPAPSPTLTAPLGTPTPLAQ